MCLLILDKECSICGPMIVCNSFYDKLHVCIYFIPIMLCNLLICIYFFWIIIIILLFIFLVLQYPSENSFTQVGIKHYVKEIWIFFSLHLIKVFNS